MSKVGDYGLIFEELIMDDTPVDISAATQLSFIFENPNGALITKSGSFSTNGIDGRFRYVLENSLFDVSGVWQYETIVVTPARLWTSDIVSFFVEDII